MGKIYFDPATRTYSDRELIGTDDQPLPNLPDRASRGPNTVFRTIDAAATDALYYCRTQQHQFVEYGGWIVKLPSGGFTYTEIIGPRRRARDGAHSTPGKVALGDPPEGAVASFHTHPRRSEMYAPSSSQEYFSEGDQGSGQWDLDHGIKPGHVYLHTPYGRIRRYDPTTDFSVTLHGPPLKGEGKGGL